MRTFTKKWVAAKVAFALVVITIPGVMTPAGAGIPVIDGGNLIQNIATAIETVAQTLKQIEQYRLQMDQYENMMQNTKKPVDKIWDDATATMLQLHNAIDTLAYYKNSLGSIDAYLGKFADTASYQNSPCYSPGGCTPDQWSAMMSSGTLGSESQKKATDALFRGLDQQQNAMQSDAIQLEKLQVAATDADGQLAAIGYANQLASHQANQLLQIRGLLIAQQNVLATRNQALADREAKEAAASVQLRAGTYHSSPAQSY